MAVCLGVGVHRQVYRRQMSETTLKGYLAGLSERGGYD
jgi:hypothetical protein